MAKRKSLKITREDGKIFGKLICERYGSIGAFSRVVHEKAKREKGNGCDSFGANVIGHVNGTKRISSSAASYYLHFLGDDPRMSFLYDLVKRD